MKRLFICLVLATICCAVCTAQKKNEAYRYDILRASAPIVIDGAIDESAWSSTQVATDFFMVLPMDTSFAKLRTEVRMAYDDRFIYISAVNFQHPPIMVESLRRDWNFQKNDNFIFFLDPFDDQTNGFTFGANAAGAEWDGQQFDGGSANLNWDNRWFSAVKRYDDRWVFEAAIPFKTLRFKKGITRWGINFSRNDLTTTEKSVWAPVPRQFPTASLAYTGVLLWDAPPPPTGPNISVIPYVLTGASKDYQNDAKTSTRFAAGGDAKVAITSSMNLDLTVNPDFSQVEVDRQQTNLDRFELFFPEKRQFFLENSDLFSSLGYDAVRPFFSRRIGLDVPIRSGLRLSGRINKDWRIGLLDVQTGSDDGAGLPAQNFGVLTVQRRLFTRSNITGFFINKENIKVNESIHGTRMPNRNAGLEYNLASRNEVWRGKFLYFKTFSDSANFDNYVASADLRYNNRKLNWGLQQQYVGNNYNPEVGYAPRRGYHKTNWNVGYNFFPGHGPVLVHNINAQGFGYATDFGNIIENETALIYNITFRDRTLLTLWTGNNYTKLLREFDPTNLTGILLPAGSEHIWNSWGTQFDSKPQRLFTFGASSRYGGYYAEGTRLRLSGYVSYRVQPYGSFAVTAEYNDIHFPADNSYGLKNASFWLISPRLDVTFTKKIYFTTFLQYNEQLNNINLNTRFQWRYAPASDLYIVYTDNYLPGDFSTNFGVKNRAIVLKILYWWNV